VAVCVGFVKVAEALKLVGDVVSELDAVLVPGENEALADRTVTAVETDTVAVLVPGEKVAETAEQSRANCQSGCCRLCTRRECSR
jgi:hypothetical protein